MTLCAKNHFGSLIRTPVQRGYYDIHPNCFSKETAIYRPLVDLIGHPDLGGKTVLYLVDGLFSGVHPRDPIPQRMQSPPFSGQWSCSLLASQDPLAIDSVGFDFLAAEWPDIAGKGGVDDYLHEAALANDPPSGTFYDPIHAKATQQSAQPGRPRALERPAAEEILAQSRDRRGHRAGQREAGGQNREGNLRVFCAAIFVAPGSNLCQN